jgi:hypothetical protein
MENQAPFNKCVLVLSCYFRANLILLYNIPGTLFTECQGREKDIASINQVLLFFINNINQFKKKMNIYPALVLFVIIYTVTGQDIAFLVPDSCRAIVCNSNSISVDFT